MLDQMHNLASDCTLVALMLAYVRNMPCSRLRQRPESLQPARRKASKKRKLSSPLAEDVDEDLQSYVDRHLGQIDWRPLTLVQPGIPASSLVASDNNYHQQLGSWTALPEPLCPPAPLVEETADGGRATTESVIKWKWIDGKLCKILKTTTMVTPPDHVTFRMQCERARDLRLQGERL